MNEFQRISIAGCPVDIATVTETIAYIEHRIATRKICRHGFINAAKVVRIQTDEIFKETLFGCDLLSPDGMSIVWASRFLGTPLPERVNGTNLMNDLVELSAKKGYRIYLLGSTEEVITKTVSVFQNKYASLEIAGYRNGYFSPDEEQLIAKNIYESAADILFVGFGTPQKEFWLKKWVSELNIPFCMGVGGSFDVVAGTVKRAPIWMQNAGLEWLYRFSQEPVRMWQRYLINNPIFMALVLAQWLKREHLSLD